MKRKKFSLAMESAMPLRKMRLLKLDAKNEQENYDSAQVIQEIPINVTECLLGRCREATYVIGHAEISRRHCMLTCTLEGKWYLHDLSMNGTFLNNQPVNKDSPVPVLDGDVITLGIESKHFFRVAICDNRSDNEPKEKKIRLAGDVDPQERRKKDAREEFDARISQEKRVLESRLREAQSKAEDNVKSSVAVCKQLETERGELREKLSRKQQELDDRFKGETQCLEAEILEESQLVKKLQELEERRQKEKQELEHQFARRQSECEEWLRVEREKMVRLQEEQKHLVAQLTSEKDQLIQRLEKERDDLLERLEIEGTEMQKTFEDKIREERTALETRLDGERKAMNQRLSEGVLERERLQKEKEELEKKMEEERQKKRDMETEMEKMRALLAEKEASAYRLSEEVQQRDKEMAKIRTEKEAFIAEMERSVKDLKARKDKLEEDKLKLEQNLIQEKCSKEKIRELEDELKSVKKQEATLRTGLAQTKSNNKWLEDAMETELQCPICNELFIQAVTLDCGHIFCSMCIEIWCKKHRTCPVCRCVVTSRNRLLMVDSYIDRMVSNLPNEIQEKRKGVLQERKDALEAQRIAEQTEAAERAATRRGRGRRGARAGARNRRGRGAAQAPAPPPRQEVPDPMDGIDTNSEFYQRVRRRMWEMQQAQMQARAALLAAVSSMPVPIAHVSVPGIPDVAEEVTVLHDQPGPSHADVIPPQPSTSTAGSNTTHGTTEDPITLSDEDNELLTEDRGSSSDPGVHSSASSEEGLPWAYYGGYGRCYNCGHRGHWSNGCPNR